MVNVINVFALHARPGKSLCQQTQISQKGETKKKCVWLQFKSGKSKIMGTKVIHQQFNGSSRHISHSFWFCVWMYSWDRQTDRQIDTHSAVSVALAVSPFYRWICTYIHRFKWMNWTQLCSQHDCTSHLLSPFLSKVATTTTDEHSNICTAEHCIIILPQKKIVCVYVWIAWVNGGGRKNAIGSETQKQIGTIMKRKGYFAKQKNQKEEKR